MNRFLLMIGVAALIAAGTYCWETAGAAESKVTPQEMPEDFQKNQMIQMNKSEYHKKLAERVGKWTFTTKMGPSFEAMKMQYTGHRTYRLIHDGKFLLGEGADVMNGQSVDALAISGYDSLTKEHTYYAVNGAYTADYAMRGQMRPDGIISYVGTMRDAMSPHGRLYRAEEVDHGKDKFEIRVYDALETKEMLVMTLTFVRAKSK